MFRVRENGLDDNISAQYSRELQLAKSTAEYELCTAQLRIDKTVTSSFCPANVTPAVIEIHFMNMNPSMDAQVKSIEETQTFL